MEESTDIMIKDDAYLRYQCIFFKSQLGINFKVQPDSRSILVIGSTHTKQTATSSSSTIDTGKQHQLITGNESRIISEKIDEDQTVIDIPDKKVSNQVIGSINQYDTADDSNNPLQQNNSAMESKEEDEDQSVLPTLNGSQENENTTCEISVSQSLSDPVLVPAIPPPFSATYSDTISWSVEGYNLNLPLTLPPPPPKLPPPPPPSLLPFHYPTNSDLATKSDENFSKTAEGDQAFKILIESDQLLGSEVKKIFKVALPLICDEESTLRDLKENISTSLALGEKLYDLATDVNSILVSYYDHDLSDYAVLDSTSWEEFIQQTKKILRLTCAPRNDNLTSHKAETEINRSRIFGGSAAFNDITRPDTNVDYSGYLTSTNENPFTANSASEPVRSGSGSGSGGDETRKASSVPTSKYRRLNNVDACNTESVIGLIHSHLTFGENAASILTDLQLDVTGDHKIWAISVNDCLIGCVVTFINGVQLSGLDKKLQLALIKQKARPLHVQFERLPMDELEFLTIKRAENLVPSLMNNASANATADGSGSNNSTAGETVHLPAEALNTSIKYPLFFSKYSHSSAARVKKRTESTIKDYLECDWSTALKERTGTPQATILSIYKYIEFELEKLQLFNNKKPQGVGVPDMDEEKWNDIREHIEWTIFKQVSKYNESLWPLFSMQSWNPSLDQDLEETSYQSKNSTRQAYELSFPDLEEQDIIPDQSIKMKLAYLRFIKMENLGLNMDESKKKGTTGNGSPPSPSPSSSSYSSVMREWIVEQTSSKLVMKEEWYLAMKGFCQAMHLETPGEILKCLVQTCKLISHALNTYMATKSKDRAVLPSINLKCKCGKVHLRDIDCNPLDFQSTSDTESISAAQKSTLESLMAYSMLAASSSESETANAEENTYKLSADDLMPAITWVLIQANPPKIEYNLWLCSEFRHPTLLRGEEAYYLAQLTSAVEFVRNAKASAFEMPLDKYMFFLRRYDSTINLLRACKDGDLTRTKELVEYHNADINALCPDNRDTAITFCIRYNQLKILEFLLESPQVVVDTLVNLYAGSNHRSTALMIAVQKGHYSMVVALLRAGANRYHQDDDANSSISIAAAKKFTRIETVLISDPLFVDLIMAVKSKNSRVLYGLLQQFVEVNYLAAPDFSQSPLIAAVMTHNIEMAKLLLANLTVKVDVNLCNAAGANAMSVCVHQCLYHQPSSDLIVIAAVLLRAGAAKHREQGHTHSSTSSSSSLVLTPLDIVKQYRSTASSNSKVMKRRSAGSFPEQQSEQPEDVNDPGKDVEIIQDMCALIEYDTKSDKIFELSRDRNFRGVRSLLMQGADVNAYCVSKKYTALIAAVYNRDFDMIVLLLQAADLFKLTDPTAIRNSLWFMSSVGEPNPSKSLVAPSSKDVEEETNKLNLDMLGKGSMSALHYAAQLGETKIIGRLLQAGATRSLLNDKGHSALDIAVTNGHLESANVLRFDPAKVSICMAAKHGDWLVMRSLMWQGVSINTQRQHLGPKGVQHELYTPLIAAAAHGQVEVLKNILAFPELDINAANAVGQTALMYASARGDETAVLRLLKAGANRWVKDKDGNVAAYWADKFGYSALAIMLKHDPSKIFVHDVIRKNYFPGVVALFKQNVDPNVVRYPIPSSSSSSGGGGSSSNHDSSTASTKPIINDESKPPALEDINAVINGETPLIVAARLNRLEVLTLLLKAPDIQVDLMDAKGWTPLFHAAAFGHEEAVMMLLRAGANRFTVDNYFRTSFAVAASLGKSLIAALIEADPYSVHIHDMCEQGRLLMVTALLKQGCPADYKDLREGKYRQSPLMAACSGTKTDIVRMLLRSQVVIDSIDEKDTIGRTALMRAAAVGALDITALLLNAGCDRTLKDNNGLTARDHASRHSFTVMIQFISQSMVR